MGRTVYWMNVSLDLRIEHAHNEQGAGTWMRIDDELHRVFNERARRLAVTVEGRVIFETMEAFWPAVASDPSSSEVMREYGHIWTSAKKILVSNSRREAPHNTTVVGGPDVFDRLAELRRDTNGDIGVGGANIATQLLQRGLLDELLLFVHPVILGAGRPLFDGDTGVVACDLVEQALFKSGVTMQRYAIRR